MGGFVVLSNHELTFPGGNVRDLALPTFHSLIQTIAPPISAHERLQIHLAHDIVGYPSLDPTVYAIFSRVMSQVEGGDLVVMQRGTESKPGGAEGFRGGNTAGWADGSWWREAGRERRLGTVPGRTEAVKLAKATAEAYANEFFSASGGIEEAAKRATENLNESTPVRSSDIFLAIQPCTDNPAETDGNDAGEDATTSFAIFLHDPVHALSFSTVSQPFPSKWVSWLDRAGGEEVSGKEEGRDDVPESIRPIVESGAMDPREWTAEWLDETLALAIGLVAQRYVAKRMGVGEEVAARPRGSVAGPGADVGAGEAARVV